MSIRNPWAASAAAAIAVLVAACGAGQPAPAAPAAPAQAAAQGAPNATAPATAAPAVVGGPSAPTPAAGTIRIEAEGQTVSRATAAPQINCCGAHWSGGTQLWFQPSAPGESVDVAFPVAQAGTYRVDVAVTGAPDYGIVTLSLDGHAMLTDFDAYAPASVVVSRQTLGTAIPLTAGTHKLTIAVTGRNPASGGRFAGIDYLDLTPA
jgi:hypothetical protein